jgi:hypothetical protein
MIALIVNENGITPAASNVAAMLVFGSVMLLVAISIDHWVESRRRSRMDAWRSKRNDKRDKKDKDHNG